MILLLRVVIPILDHFLFLMLQLNLLLFKTKIITLHLTMYNVRVVRKWDIIPLDVILYNLKTTIFQITTSPKALQIRLLSHKLKKIMIHFKNLTIKVRSLYILNMYLLFLLHIMLII